MHDLERIEWAGDGWDYGIKWDGMCSVGVQRL